MICKVPSNPNHSMILWSKKMVIGRDLWKWGKGKRHSDLQGKTREFRELSASSQPQQDYAMCIERISWQQRPGHQEQEHGPIQRWQNSKGATRGHLYSRSRRSLVTLRRRWQRRWSISGACSGQSGKDHGGLHPAGATCQFGGPWNKRLLILGNLLPWMLPPD